jgi:hypothetical protein
MRRSGALSENRADPDRLLHHPAHAHGARGHSAGSCLHHVVSRLEGEDRTPPGDCQMDVPDLAIRQCHRGHRVFDAVPVLNTEDAPPDVINWEERRRQWIDAVERFYQKVTGEPLAESIERRLVTASWVIGADWVTELDLDINGGAYDFGDSGESERHSGMNPNTIGASDTGILIVLEVFGFVKRNLSKAKPPAAKKGMRGRSAVPSPVTTPKPGARSHSGWWFGR